MKHPSYIRQFIFDNYKGTSYKKMSMLLKDKFDYDMTTSQIKSFYGNNNLNSGLTGRFKKGNVPVNKGTKGKFNVGGNRTSFKKGNMPSNTDVIGTIKKLKDGYLWVKVDNQIKPKNKKVNWKPLHKYIYEFFNGKVPDEYDVMFLDGNIRNFDKENIDIVTKAERLYLNRNGLINENGEITKSSLALARMVCKVNKLTDRNQKRECK